MQRVPAQARVLMAATVALGTGVVTIATVGGSLTPLTTLALLATAVVLTELFQVPSDDASFDPADATTSSFSTGVHFAAVLILGPWAAAVVAALGVVALDRLRDYAWSRVFFNAGVFALAAFAGGQAFQLAGGEPGMLALPAELPAIAVLAVVYAAVNNLLVGSIVALTAGTPPHWQVWNTFRGDLPSTVAQAGFGVLLALSFLIEPWAIAALAPLLVTIYLAHGRLATLRRETAHALETFANVVDERDPYTYRHSARVGEHVRRLAESLGLPSAEVSRLHWAGRLHDLGKIAVDASVLRKSTPLDEDEWAALRRHPRLSARLLQRFRFASGEARAVEYHHERADGGGYYGVEPESVPVAAHFLIVADAYDAMRSDRPYRAALPEEAALAEIEAKAGTQFHPAVARAFVALERGQDPASALSSAELAELRGVSLRGGPLSRDLRNGLKVQPQLIVTGSIVGALAALGFEQYPLAAAALLTGVSGLAWRRVQLFRAGRLSDTLRQAIGATEREAVFCELVSRLAYCSHLRWAGLVSWRGPELAGSVELDWGSRDEAPNETSLTSWLIRETESSDDVVRAGADDLGGKGAHLALPLRRDGSVTGYLVLAFARALPYHVEVALSRCGEDVGHRLAPSRPDRPEAEPARLAAVS